MATQPRPSTSGPIRRKHRVIVGLLEAKPCASPWTVNPRPRGTKAQGLRYERAVGSRISACAKGQWFKYRDAKGEGYCSPDILMPHQGLTAILECKLTEVEEARLQLAELYKPVVELAYGRPAITIVVARSLTKETDPSLVVDSLAQALKLALEGLTPTLHWLGTGPL